MLFLVCGLALAAISGAQTQPGSGAGPFRQQGIASWYGVEFNGLPTASGEVFNAAMLTAAHPSLPFGTVVKVTNTQNNRQVMVRVNDRGPFIPDRIIDLSRAAAEQLDMINTGTAPVVVESLTNVAAAPAPAPVPAPSPPPPDPAMVSVPAADGSAVVITITQAGSAPPVVNAQTIDPAPRPVPVYTAPAPTPAPTPAPAPMPAVTILPPEPKPSPAAVSTPAVIRINLPSTIDPVKNYTIQVGAYKVARHATETFDKLKNAGLDPVYERYEDYYQVVLRVRGDSLLSVAERLGASGFREAWVRN